MAIQMLLPPLGAVQTEPQAIRLRIEDGAQELEVALDKPICLGRIDPVSGRSTVIDLEASGGLEKGVSRCHARLSKQGAELVIEDLGSRNGTYLNAQRLLPFTPQIVQDGDYLHLGLLLVQVKILTGPAGRN